MEILGKAYNITSKYGISLYNFGPFLSYVNNKIGICLDIKDAKYNYLTRNFSFDNLKDFEEFIKKYAYYKNILKGDSGLSLGDYKSVSPMINYGFEKEEELKKLNEQKLVEAIIEESESIYLYVEKIYNERIDKLILRDKARMTMNNHLLEYKYNLHHFYGREYHEEMNSMLDETVNKYQKKAKQNLRSLRMLLDKLESKKDLNEVNEVFKNIITVIKGFESDTEYLGLLYDLYLYKNKSYVVELMNKRIIQELNREEKIKPNELKNELENIKNSVMFNNTKENFINESVKDIKEKYITVQSIEPYNVGNFLNNNEFIKLEVVENSKSDGENIKNNYITQYNILGESEKNCLLILFSPFRKIINNILKYPENTKFDEYYDFYETIIEKLDMTDNLLFKEKYFRDIDFTNFESFVLSLKIIAENLSKITFVVDVEEKYWAYKKDEPLVFASRELIKSVTNPILSILIKPGANILYSNNKIRIVNDKFIVEDNDDIFIINSLNEFRELGFNEQVKDFRYITKKVNIKGRDLDLVVEMEENGIYNYVNYIVGEKQND